MAETFGIAGNATFVHGNPLMVDLTPTTALPAGAVYQPNDGTAPGVYVAHSKIDANKLGAVAAHGGVYDMISDGTVDAGGVAVYWDDSADRITTVATVNNHFGYSVPGQGATAPGDTCRIVHMPSATATGAGG